SQLGFQTGNAERSVIEFHLLLIVAVRRVVASNHLQRPISQPGQNGLPIACRAERRVHFEVRIIIRPGGTATRVRTAAKNPFPVLPPKQIAAGDGGISQSKMMGTSLARYRDAALFGS